MRTYPTITVVVATYNSGSTIARCLASVRMQSYPQEKISIIIVDGGSSDDTRAIVKAYDIDLIAVDPKKQNAEYNKSLGISKATGEILFLLDHDNILPHKNWLKRMVEPLQKHPDVVGVETLRYRYDPDTSLLDRYFSLFGALDPLAWYLGKADRLSYIYDTYKLFGEATDHGNYYTVIFSSQEIPTLGANGFLIRRKLLLKHANAAPGKFFHIDVNVDLIRKGYNTYAFVKDDILHLSGYGTVWYFLKRRMLFMQQYYLSESTMTLQRERRYSVYEPKDTAKLLGFIFISLTIVVPLIDSIRGWKKIHDPAWFLHPFLCFGIATLYGYVIIKHQISLYAKKILGK